MVESNVFGLDQLIMILIVLGFVGFGWYLFRRQQQKELYDLIRYVLSLNDAERKEMLSTLNNVIALQKSTQDTLSELLRTQQATLHNLDPDLLRLLSQLGDGEIKELVGEIQKRIGSS